MLDSLIQQGSSSDRLQALHRVTEAGEPRSRDRGERTMVNASQRALVLVLHDSVPLHQLQVASRVSKFGMDLIQPLVITPAWMIEVTLLHYWQLELDDIVKPVILRVVFLSRLESPLRPQHVRACDVHSLIVLAHEALHGIAEEWLLSSETYCGDRHLGRDHVQLCRVRP